MHINSQNIIQSSQIDIQSQKHEIVPHSFHLNIQSEYEISGDFELPDNFFKTTYFFPNQKVEEIFLKLERKKYCLPKNPFHKKCFVYKTNAKLSLSGDKFFAREISQDTKVEFEIKFLAEEKVLNSLNKLIAPEKQKTLSEFVKNILDKNFFNNFLYRNTYKLKSIASDKNIQKTNLLKKIIIDQQKPIYFFETVDFVFPNNNSITNSNIAQWFEIISSNSLLTETLTTEIVLKQKEQIYTIPINKNIFWNSKNDKKHHIFKSLSNIKRNNKFDSWVEDPVSNNGLFIPEISEGLFNHDFLLFFDNLAHKIKLSNSFSFSKNHLPINRQIATIYKKSNFKWNPKELNWFSVINF